MLTTDTEKATSWTYGWATQKHAALALPNGGVGSAFRFAKNNFDSIHARKSIRPIQFDS